VGAGVDIHLVLDNYGCSATIRPPG
jgi:hypothetical protein